MYPLDTPVTDLYQSKQPAKLPSA